MHELIVISKINDVITMRIIITLYSLLDIFFMVLITIIGISSIYKIVDVVIRIISNNMIIVIIFFIKITSA